MSDPPIQESNNETNNETNAATNTATNSQWMSTEKQIALSYANSAWKFFVKNHLPIGLLIAILIGSFWNGPERVITSIPLPWSSLSISIIFFIQGLKLETKEFVDALKSGRAVLFGHVFILLISPLLALPITWISILDPVELSMGLALFLTMPTTISTGAVLTREAYGNASLALLLSVGSTMVGLAVLPLTIQTFALSSAKVEFDTLGFLANLSLTVMLPITVGKLIRDYYPPTIPFVKSTHNLSKYVSSMCLILLPFLQISQSGEVIRSLSALALFLTLMLSFVLHVILLACNVAICHFGEKLLAIDLGKKKAIILSCSAKTVAIGVAVLPMIDYAPDKKGLLAVSLVIAHLVQTVIDSMITEKWKADYEAQQARVDEMRRELNVDEMEHVKKLDDDEMSHASISMPDVALDQRTVTFECDSDDDDEDCHKDLRLDLEDAQYDDEDDEPVKRSRRWMKSGKHGYESLVSENQLLSRQSVKEPEQDEFHSDAYQSVTIPIAQHYSPLETVEEEHLENRASPIPSIRI